MLKEDTDKMSNADVYRIFTNEFASLSEDDYFLLMQEIILRSSTCGMYLMLLDDILQFFAYCRNKIPETQGLFSIVMALVKYDLGLD